MFIGMYLHEYNREMFALQNKECPALNINNVTSTKKIVKEYNIH